MAPLYAGRAIAASGGFLRPIAPIRQAEGPRSDRRDAGNAGFHLCPLSSLSTARIPLVRLGFHDSFRSVAETIDRQRSKAFPATAGAKAALLSHQARRRWSEGPGG